MHRKKKGDAVKKEIFSVCLLSLMLISALINTRCIYRLTNEMSSLIEESIDAVREDNWEYAENRIKLADRMWEEKKGYTHIVLRHSEIDTVSDALYDCISCVYDRRTGDAVIAAQKVMYYLDSMYGMERVRFGSIF